MLIGTRASALALAQAQLIADALPGSVLVPATTRDESDGADGANSERSVQGVALDGGALGGGVARRRIDDKSRWVRALENALLRGEVDLAVHSAKDVPAEMPAGLALLGASARAGAEDVLCGAVGLDALPSGARVGTSSLRRAAQLLAAREDLEVVAVSGNVDTRLRKLAQADREGLTALVLARAGLERLGREEEIGAVLDPEVFIPAPGQGVLALQGREDDERVREEVAAIGDSRAFSCLLAERALARALSATCNTPVGAHAVPLDRPGQGPSAGDRVAADGSARPLLLRAWVGLPDGSAWARDELIGEEGAPVALGEELAARLKLAGAGELLSRAEEMAAVGGG